MRYVQLRAFHHVAISGGFSRAAAELFLTQPAISDQVRKLEAEYDVLLFNRERRQVTLTPAGEDLLAITRRLFDAEGQALELLSESRALRSGRLRIVADAAHHIVHVLRAFRERYPGVMVSVRSGNTETVVENLLAYEADIGVLGDLNPSRDFDIIRLNATPITAFTSRDNPLAGTSSLSLAELAGLPLVGREVGSKTRRRLEEAAAKTGVELKFAIEAEGREAMREIVASGLGIGFVSEAEFGLDPRLVRIAIRGEPVLMDEALICLSERSQAKTIRAFLDLARSMSPDMS